MQKKQKGKAKAEKRDEKQTSERYRILQSLMEHKLRGTHHDEQGAPRFAVDVFSAMVSRRRSLTLNLAAVGELGDLLFKSVEADLASTADPRYPNRLRIEVEIIHMTPETRTPPMQEGGKSVNTRKIGTAHESTWNSRTLGSNHSADVPWWGKVVHNFCKILLGTLLKK